MGSNTKLFIIIGITIITLAVVGTLIGLGVSGKLGGKSRSTTTDPTKDGTITPDGTKNDTTIITHELLQRAVWAWDVAVFVNTTTYKPDVENQYWKFLQAKNITDVYLQVNRDYTIPEMYDILTEFKKLNIAVHALDGAIDMVVEGSTHHTRYLNFIQYIKDYHAAHPDTSYTGIHVDIESWSRNGFDIPERVKAWQDLMLQTQQTAHELKMVFGSDISASFNLWTYNNEYGTGRMSDWCAQYLDFVAIMAYRNKIDGSNGVYDIVVDELEYATNSTSILNKNDILQNMRYQRPSGIAGQVIGLETEYSDETYGSQGQSISYYGSTAEHFNNALKQLHDITANQTSYAGFAIHHIESWIKFQ